jgi:hypothetical protein
VLLVVRYVLLMRKILFFCAESVSRGHSPPQPRRGGRDIKKNVAKPPLPERTGWCWSREPSSIDQHHPGMRLSKERGHFLTAQPPLLG